MNKMFCSCEEDVFLNHFIKYVPLKEGETKSQNLAWKQTALSVQIITAFYLAEFEALGAI